MKSIAASQIRAARGLLGIQQKDLAQRAAVALKTVKRAERGDSMRADTLEAIRAALETLGAEFIPENGGGCGVRMKKRGR